MLGEIEIAELEQVDGIITIDIYPRFRYDV